MRLFPRWVTYHYVLCCRGGQEDQQSSTTIITGNNMLHVVLALEVPLEEKEALIDAFLHKGLDINALDKDGDNPGHTPLDAVILSQGDSSDAPALVEFLLARGARLDIKSGGKTNPITPQERAQFFVDKYPSPTSQKILDIILKHKGA